MSKARIAFFGSSLVSAYWNGAATYYRGILRALHNQGYDITFYEPDAYERQQHRDITDPDYAKSVVYTATIEDAQAMLRLALDADIVVKASGVGVLDDFLEREVLELQSPERRIIFWDVDAPATLYGVKNNPDNPFRELIREYDCIFTYGGGNPVVQDYLSWGARRCEPIYNALDPDTHYPVPPDPQFACSLAFLGNRMPDREERVHRFFFEAARLLPEHKFLLGGNGWDYNIPRLLNLDYVGHVYTQDHNAFNCTPLAVLNINRESMAHYGFSPPTRVFEAAGAGACIITDAWQGIELFLEPNLECLVAHNGDEVAEHLRELTPARAKQIGNAALSRVLNEHTYAHRAVQVESILEESKEVQAQVLS